MDTSTSLTLRPPRDGVVNSLLLLSLPLHYSTLSKVPKGIYPFLFLSPLPCGSSELGVLVSACIGGRAGGHQKKYADLTAGDRSKGSDKIASVLILC